MVEVGRDLKGRETRVRRWMFDRFLQNNFIFIYLSIVVILFIFYFLSVNCLLLFFFFCCLICVDFFCYPLFFLFVCFFLLYFALFFVGFGGLGLPCHLLCCLLLFVYFFKNLFLFYLFFFYLHGFSGFIFCKFNCSWHFFTSSDRVPPGGGCTWAPFRGLVSRGSKLYKWWFGKASGLIDIELMNMVPRKRLTMGWEDDTWAQGGVRLLLPPGWSWLDDLGDGVNCLFFFLSFENPWGLMAGNQLQWTFSNSERLVLFVAGGSEGPQVGRWIPQCFLEHYSCYDTDRTAEITDAPTS